MDALSIQAKVNRGFAIGARILGRPCQVFRPDGPANPLDPANLIDTIEAAFDTGATFPFTQPSAYGKNENWYGMFDQTGTRVGDYIVSPTDTYFIASQEGFSAARTVRCTRTAIAVRRTVQNPPPGSYGSVEHTTALLSNWPMSEAQWTRMEKGPTGLPSDNRLPWCNFMLPITPGVVLAIDDLLDDDLGRTWVLCATELSPLGWRLTAQLSDT